MKEKRIDLETAKLAKEKYFFIDENRNSFTAYKTNDLKSLSSVYKKFYPNYREMYFKEWAEFYLFPTQNLLSKWLREIHNIDVDVTRDSEVHYNDEVRWIVKVSDWNDIRLIDTSIAQLKHPNHFHFTDFKSFEEAFEVGLVEGLKMIKLAE